MEPGAKPGSWRTHQYGSLAGVGWDGSAGTPTSAAQIKWAQESAVPEGPHCPGDAGQVAADNEAPAPGRGHTSLETTVRPRMFTLKNPFVIAPEPPPVI